MDGGGEVTDYRLHIVTEEGLVETRYERGKSYDAATVIARELGRIYGYKLFKKRLRMVYANGSTVGRQTAFVAEGMTFVVTELEAQS